MFTYATHMYAYMQNSDFAYKNTILKTGSCQHALVSRNWTDRNDLGPVGTARCAWHGLWEFPETGNWEFKASLDHTERHCLKKTLKHTNTWSLLTRAMVKSCLNKQNLLTGSWLTEELNIKLKQKPTTTTGRQNHI